MSCTTVACVPGAIHPGERAQHFALARELFNEQALERRERADGFELRFDAEALEPVARFIRNERKCCPFVRFELSVEAGSSELWLRMTGPEGTRDALASELDLRIDECCG